MVTAKKISKIVGGYILKHRKYRGLNQEQLSEISGVTTKQIRKIEKHGDGKFINVVRVLQAMDLDYLLKSFKPESYDSTEDKK